MSSLTHTAALLLSAGLLLAAGCTRGRYADKPPRHPNPNMVDQERANAQSKSKFFANGATQRAPVDGTVAQGWLNADSQQPLALSLAPQGAIIVTPLADGAAANTTAPGFLAEVKGPALAQYYTGRETAAADAPPVAHSPVPFTAQFLERGRQRYDIFCAPCHDAAGSGNGMTVQKGMLRPAAFSDDRALKLTDGEIFSYITNGSPLVNGTQNMPPHRHQIPVSDRWAIVGYVRALQLSQHAPAEAVPPAQRSKLDAH